MKTSIGSSSESEGEYTSFYILLCEVLAGSKPVDVLLVHAEFERRLKRICYAIGESREKAAELFQDACVRLLTYGCAINPNNIEGADQFFSWLYVLVRNIRCSEFRRKRVPLADIPVEEILQADPRINLEATYYLRELLEFSKTLPDECRRAVELRLEDRSFREIEEILCNEGHSGSHVTVQKRISNALRDFSNGSSVKKAIGF